MKKLIAIWCWIVGHNWVTGSRFSNASEIRDITNSSQWGHSECHRCKITHTWQWDN